MSYPRSPVAGRDPVGGRILACVGKIPLQAVDRMFRIPLGPHAVKALKAHQTRVVRNGDDDLVFGNRKGDPLRECKLLTNMLQPAAEAAGLGRVTWHQFRHIHSSLLNDLNVPVKIAQEQLGHASIATTLNIYTHAVDGLVLVFGPPSFRILPRGRALLDYVRTTAAGDRCTPRSCRFALPLDRSEEPEFSFDS